MFEKLDFSLVFGIWCWYWRHK